MTALSVSSLVLYASDLAATAAFYRAVGLPLEDEDHDEGPVHVAVELGGVHFAIYPAQASVGASAPAWCSAGGDFPGFYVESLDDATAALADVGAPLVEAHDWRPWGCRIVVQDPDGRTVEVNQKSHC